MHINNEIGNILNLELVSSLCHKYNALFHGTYNYNGLANCKKSKRIKHLL